MKKDIGAQLALYPMPATIIGANNGDKPTWTLVAHVGVIGHDRVLVSLLSAHFINGCIKKSGRLSINLVDEPMLPEADLSGSLSGNKADKSGLFEYELTPSGTPIIKKAPLSIDCVVDDIYNTPGFESFICRIESTYVEEGDLNEAGKIDYGKLKPVLFEMPTYQYLKTGDVLGPCLSFGKAKK